VEIVVAIIVLLFSLTVHESSHALAARQLGDDTAYRLGRVSLNPMVHIDPIGTILVPIIALLLPGGMLFGWAKPVPVNGFRLRNPLRDHALIAAAGPASNLLLALVFAVLLGIVAGFGHRGLFSGGGTAGAAGVFLRLLCQWGISLNILLALFNLIPLPPLDGGWILRAGLHGQAAELFERIRPYGFLLILVLMNVGLGAYLGGAMSRVAGIYLHLVNGLANLIS
jgi:Zn-dependent protease